MAETLKSETKSAWLEKYKTLTLTGDLLAFRWNGENMKFGENLEET